jgi:hypothetical protein
LENENTEKMKAKYPYRFSIQVVFCSFAFLISSCKKFVQIGSPTTQLVTSSVFSNSASATSAVLAIYIQMFNNTESYNIAEDQGLLSDELTNYSTNVNQVQYYTNALEPLESPGEWVHAYNYIYQANAIISGLQNNGQIAASIAEQLTGEAKFIRAFWHFYLTNMYGNIPIVTTTDYTVNESLSRSSQAQVYSQITQDLQDAESLLNSNYVDATDTAITSQRVRPTKGAAEALLARVYLYQGKYDSAETAASNVINNSLYMLSPNLSGPKNSVFLMNSSEAIWQLSTPLPNLNNTLDAQYFILLGAPSGTTGTFNSTTLSPELLNSFEPGDLRRSNWIDSIIKSGVPYYFPYKYHAVNTTTLTEFTMVMRLAEQYLIRAESEAELNDLTDAATDLNVIRNRAGLSNISNSIASSQTTLLTAILHERQVELFTEWGHRWFDLIRTGTVNAVMGSPDNVCQMKGGTWNPDWQLYPIPQTEITNDANLTQNLGYN